MPCIICHHTIVSTCFCWPFFRWIKATRISRGTSKTTSVFSFSAVKTTCISLFLVSSLSHIFIIGYQFFNTLIPNVYVLFFSECIYLHDLSPLVRASLFFSFSPFTKYYPKHFRKIFRSFVLVSVLSFINWKTHIRSVMFITMVAIMKHFQNETKQSHINSV